MSATLDFNIKTKSGDTISLSAYNKRSSSASIEQNEQETTYTMKKEISMGYAFHYEGNGIDENDKKEIDEALKKMQPSITEFVKTLSDNSTQEKKTPSSLIVSMSEFLSSMAPKPKDINTQNYEKSGILDNFSKALHDLKPIQKALDDIGDLMLKVFMKVDGTAEHNGKTFYA
jgi:hypothetical protein